MEYLKLVTPSSLSRPDPDVASPSPAWGTAFSMIRNAPVAMGLIRDGRFVFVTEQLADLLNLTAAEVEGTCYLDYLHPGDTPYLRRLDAEKHRTVVARLNDRERERWVRARFGPETGEGETLVAFEEITDIREHRKGHFHLFREMAALVQKSVLAMGKILGEKDPYTQTHQVRVSRLAFAMGERGGFDADHLMGLLCAARLHDLGKISVPSEILCKPRRLTENEWAIIRTHPETGTRILSEIPFPLPVGDIILQHHERLDGSGYPRGLKGDEILTEARFLAVADVFEAMTADRPYRAGLPLSDAVEELQSGSGIRYDSRAVRICLQLLEEGFSIEEDNLTGNPTVNRHLWHCLIRPFTSTD